MKISTDRLKQIIKEEIQRVTEGDPVATASDIDPEGLSYEDDLVHGELDASVPWDSKSPEERLLSLIHAGEELRKRLKGGETVEEVYELLNLEEDPKISDIIRNMITPLASLYS